MSRAIVNWCPLLIVYNGFLLLLSIYYLEQAFSGDLYIDAGMVIAKRPLASNSEVAINTVVALSVLNICFLVFGPAIELSLHKLIPFKPWARLSHFTVGLLLAMLIHKQTMLGIVQPF